MASKATASLRTCITCGEKAVARGVVTVQRLDGTRVSGVSAHVCSNCGERYFDLAAMRRIESASGKPGKAKRRAA